MIRQSKLEYAQSKTKKEQIAKIFEQLQKEQEIENLAKSKKEEAARQEALQKEQGAKRLEQACTIYYKLVEERKKDFQEVKQYLSQTLEQLLENGKIGNGVILLSRIKSPVSVVENWRLGKNLHDIFGITLLTQTDKEMEQIKQKLDNEKKYNMVSTKKMNKTRGYEASHFLFNIQGENSKKTNVECHMQTHEQYKNVYPHILYKVRRNLDRDLTKKEEEQVQEQVQQMFENGELAGRKISENRRIRLPEMWVSTFNDNGKMEEIELDEIQKMLVMYPFLDLSKKQPENSTSQKAKIENLECTEIEQDER